MLEIAGVFSINIVVDHNVYESIVNKKLEPYMKSETIVKILKISKPFQSYDKKTIVTVDCVYKITTEEVHHFSAESDYLGIVLNTLRSTISSQVFSPTIFSIN